MRHHYRHRNKEFGVSNGFWDYVFDTAIWIWRNIKFYILYYNYINFWKKIIFIKFLKQKLRKKN